MGQYGLYPTTHTLTHTHFLCDWLMPLIQYIHAYLHAEPFIQHTHTHTCIMLHLHDNPAKFMCIYYNCRKQMLHIKAHVVQYGGTCMCIKTHTHTRTQDQCAVNGVFDWNRMTVGIHAGFPLLNSAIRLTVYGSADVPAHLSDLQPVYMCVCMCAKLPTCSQ